MSGDGDVESGNAFEKSKPATAERTLPEAQVEELLARQRRQVEKTLKENAERQAFLLKLSDALRSKSDPVDIQQTAVRLLAEHLDVMRATYWELDPDDNSFTLTARYERDATPVPQHFHLSDFGPEISAAYRSGQTIVFRDTETELHLGSRPEMYRALGLRAWIATPLVKDGRLIATVGVNSATPRDWTATDVQIVEDVGERTWAAVERARAEEALRQSETKYRTLFERMDEGFALCELVRDADGRVIDYRYVDVNPALVRNAGIHPDALRGQRATEFFPDLDPWLIDSYARVVETGQSLLDEHYFHHVDRWLRINAFPRGGDRFAVLFGDVTERKRAEAALRESEARLATELEDARVLQRISNELVSDTGRNGHFDHIVEAARTLMRSDAASIQELDADSRLKLLAHTGFHADSAAFWEYVDADVGSSCGRALTARERVVVPDMDRFDADPHDIAAYRKSGIMSVQSTPLVASSGRIVGMMSTHWSHPHTPGVDSYRFFDILARLAADFIERAHAEEALRESEEKYRTLFASVDEGFCVYELITEASDKVIDLRYLDTNPAFEKHMGFRPLPGQTARELVPGLEDSWFQLNGGVARTGQSQRFENFATELQKWFEVSVVPFPTHEGKLAGIFADITDRKLREQQKDYLLKLSDALRPLADPAQIKLEASRVLGEELGVNRALYAEVVGDNWWAERGYVRDVDPLPTGAYSSDTYGHWIMQTYCRGQTLVFGDVHSDSRFTKEQRAAAESASIIGAVGVPLVKSGDLVALLSVHTAQPHKWTAHEIGLVEETAERTWAAVERAKAEEALRASETKYRTLFETMGEGFAICDMVRDEAGRYIDYVHVELNEAFERQTGARREQFIGKAFSEMVGPTDFAKWMGFYSRVAATGEPAVVEDYVERHNRWFEVSIYRQAGDRLFMFYRDITERKERERQQEFLLKFSDDLRTLGDAKTIEETGVRMLAEYLRLDRAYVFVLYPAEDRAVVRSEHRAERFASIVGEVRMSDFPETVVQIEDETLVVNDTDSDERLSALNRASLHAVNLEAFVCASVRKGEKTVIWSLAAVSATPRTWTKAEVELIETVAERIWVTAEKARAEEALRASEEKFSALFAASPAPFLIVSPDAPRFTVFEVNDAYLAATMRTREDLVGTGLFEAFPDNPHDPAADGVRNLRASLTRALESGRPDAMPVQKYDIARADGSFEERWWRPVNSPVLNQSGQLQAIIHHVSDVTEEHSAEIALRKSEERLRRVLDGMGEGFGLLAPDFTILEHNGEALRIDGRAREEIVGRSHWDAFPGSEASELGHVLKKAMAERVPVSLEHLYAWEEGRALWLEMRAYPMSDGSLAVFWRDVTDRREAQDALRSSEARQAFLVRLSDAVRGLSDPSLVATAASRLLTEQLGTERTAWADIDWTTREYVAERVFLADGAPGESSRWPLDPQMQFVAEQLAGRSVAYEDIETDSRIPESAKVAMAAQGIRAGIAVPIVIAGTLRAVFSTSQHAAPRRWWPEEVALVEAFAGRAWAEIERARAEEALRASEARFRAVADLVPDLVWQSEPDGSTLWYNARWLEYTGQTLDEARGWGWTDAIHPDDRARSAANYARAAERGELLVQEHRIRRHDGAYRWFLARAEPLRDDAGSVVRWFGAATDIHAQRTALEEVERLVAERTGERDTLRRHLSQAEEAERQRLSRELHDQLGQQLTAFRLGLEDAARLANGGDGNHADDAPLSTRIRQLQTLADTMMRGARYIALELRPPELDDVGLASALETYAREWGSRYGIATEVTVIPSAEKGTLEDAVPRDIASALYRITQEGLTNIAKHAQATQVSIVVDQRDSEVRLIMEDNGQGFDVDETRTRARHERRLGLGGMEERAMLLGGRLVIESTPDSGTTLYVRLPLAR